MNFDRQYCKLAFKVLATVLLTVDLILKRSA